MNYGSLIHADELFTIERLVVLARAEFNLWIKNKHTSLYRLRGLDKTCRVSFAKKVQAEYCRGLVSVPSD